MSDAFYRALRTFFQGFLGVLIGTGILSIIAADGAVDWSILMKAVVSAVAGGVIAIVSFIQNTLEDGGQIPKFFKNVN